MCSSLSLGSPEVIAFGKQEGVAKEILEDLLLYLSLIKVGILGYHHVLHGPRPAYEKHNLITEGEDEILELCTVVSFAWFVLVSEPADKRVHRRVTFLKLFSEPVPFKYKVDKA